MSTFPALLMLHLIALTLMAGSTTIEFVNYRTFWKLFGRQQEQAAGVLSAIAKSSKLIGMGAALIIVTGSGMIALTHGLLAQQLWFRIKIIFVILLIINGIFNGNKLGFKLRKVISEGAPGMMDQAMNLKGRLQTFHLMQLCIFIIIIFLSAYKFN